MKIDASKPETAQTLKAVSGHATRIQGTESIIKLTYFCVLVDSRR